MNTCQDACNKVFLYLLQETVTAKKQKKQKKSKQKQNKTTQKTKKEK